MPVDVRGPTIQEMGCRATSLGPVLYIRIWREDGRAMYWSDVWEVFADRYPGQWAVQFFPPAEELVDEVNMYHLFVLDEPPRGVSIKWRP